MHRPGTCDRRARWAPHPATGPCHRGREPHPTIQAQMNWSGHPFSTRGPHVAPHLHPGNVTALRSPSTEHPARHPGRGLGDRVCGSQIRGEAALPLGTQGNALAEGTNHPRATCVALPTARRRRAMPSLPGAPGRQALLAAQPGCLPPCAQGTGTGAVHTRGAPPPGSHGRLDSHFLLFARSSPEHMLVVFPLIYRESRRDTEEGERETHTSTGPWIEPATQGTCP